MQDLTAMGDEELVGEFMRASIGSGVSANDRYVLVRAEILRRMKVAAKPSPGSKCLVCGAQNIDHLLGIGVIQPWPKAFVDDEEWDVVQKSMCEAAD